MEDLDDQNKKNENAGESYTPSNTDRRVLRGLRRGLGEGSVVIGPSDGLFKKTDTAGEGSIMPVLTERMSKSKNTVETAGRNNIGKSINLLKHRSKSKRQEFKSTRKKSTMNSNSRSNNLVDKNQRLIHEYYNQVVVGCDNGESSEKAGI